MKPLPDLSRAFSPVPPVVHTRMTQTLEEIHHMKKRNVSVAFALAAVLALTLVGAALAAAQSGVMRFLLGDTAPNAAQQQMVQPVGLSHQSKDMTVTVTDAVFDGAQSVPGAGFQPRTGRVRADRPSDHQRDQRLSAIR